MHIQTFIRFHLCTKCSTCPPNTFREFLSRSKNPFCTFTLWTSSTLVPGHVLVLHTHTHTRTHTQAHTHARTHTQHTHTHQVVCQKFAASEPKIKKPTSNFQWVCLFPQQGLRCVHQLTAPSIVSDWDELKTVSWMGQPHSALSVLAIPVDLQPE